MKRSFSSTDGVQTVALVASGVALIAATYGLVRLAYGLLLPDAQRDLGVDAPTAGAISAGASAVYCLGAVVGFAVATRHPRALVIAAGIGAGLGAIGMASAGDASAFAVASIAASSGAGLASPALVAVLRAHRATASQPRLQSVVNAGTGPGVAIAALLALAVEWRTVWVVAATATAVGAIATLVAHHPEPAEDGAAHAPARVPLAWWRAHTTPIAAAMLLGAGSAATWSFGRTILVGAGATDVDSTLAWVALGAGGAGAVVTAGVLDRLGPRRAWAVTVATVAVATAVLATWPAASVAAIAACAAFGWGYTAGSGALIAWTATIDDRHAAAGTAMLFVVLVLGQAVGAAAVGALEPMIGLPAAFALAAIVAVVAAATSATGWSRVRGRADWSA